MKRKAFFVMITLLSCLTIFCCIKLTLKNRILYSLSIIHTLFCHFTQPLSPRFGLRINIIRYKYKHTFTYFHKKGGYSSKSPRKQRAKSIAWA